MEKFKTIVISDMSCGEKIVPATKTEEEYMETSIKMKFRGNVEEIAEFNQAVLSGMTVKVGFQILPPAAPVEGNTEE
jgi:hypothetical protein